MTKSVKFYIVFTLFIGFCMQNAAAQEFHNFKLKPKFKQLKAQQGLNKNHRKGKKSILPREKEMSPLLDEIYGILQGDYENIGMDQTRTLIENHSMGGGVQNFSGFTWYKPMLNYNISANREVAPDLESDKWIVHDTFTIYINASTLLKNFRDQDLIEITDTAIGAFAGVTFTRRYHYYHFAKDYLDGISKDYSKLFLSFRKFQTKKLEYISPYEVIKKTDSFSYNAGGIVKAPVGNGMQVEAGVLTKKSLEQEVSIQALGREDNKVLDEKVRISSQKEVKKMTGAHLSLQYDFFNLLKVSLLSYDLDYEFSESSKLYLSLFNQDLAQLKEKSARTSELKKILKGSHSVRLWQDNIVSQEMRSSQNLNSKFSFFLLGNMKKRATEQIKIIKGNIEKVFFKNYAESKKYTESLFSRIFGQIIQRIFNFNSQVRNSTEVRKSMKIEYEHLKYLKPTEVENEQQFSLEFEQNFLVDKTHRWYHKRKLKKALSYTERMTTLYGKLKNKIKNKELRGPIKIRSTLQVGAKGIDYFNQLPVEKILGQIRNACNYKGKKYKRQYRGGHLRKTMTSSYKCFSRLSKKYHKYRAYLDDTQIIKLNYLKEFLGAYYERIRSIKTIIPLFGSENTFLHGNISASTHNNLGFQTFFKYGNFNGGGVINSFKNSWNHVVVEMD